MIDREREVEALLALVKETGLRLIQLRNLNIDPRCCCRVCPRSIRWARHWACAP